MATIKTKGKGGNSAIIVALIIVSALVFTSILTLVKKVFETEIYYVLNQDIPTRTQVLPEMLEPVTTSKGTSPKAAIGLDEVQTGRVYTLYPLQTGDILTMSNVGALQDISVGVPDEWVVTNFSVGADNAAGGRITRGTYFDMLVVSDEGAFYPFVNVLALDTTIDLSNASHAGAVDTEEAHAGQTTQYFVGMTPENAAKLHNIMAKYGSGIKLVLSPRANEYSKPNLSAYDGLFKYERENDSSIWPGKSDDGELTDRTFTPLERDKFGKPKAKLKTCSEGNAKVSGEACKNGDGKASPSAEPSASDAPVTEESSEKPTTGSGE